MRLIVQEVVVSSYLNFVASNKYTSFHKSSRHFITIQNPNNNITDDKS